MNEGFALIRVEVLNWGNFQGRQSFELTGEGNSFPNALIAGVNGSGKSTLIDAVMTVLLPFSRSLHLGVTHDSESGAGGGRTINDYVLGKYSATGEEAVDNLNMTFSRDQGMSAVLLVFRRNDETEEIITAARTWWYMNHSLKEKMALLIAPEELTIAGTDMPALSRPDGSIFTNPGELRRHLESKSARTRLYFNVGAYFQDLCRTFGNMTMDDLKLLNRAFYMKSVGQIDGFIRNYMLVEQSNESVDKLIENVEIAAQITNDIQYCEDRLKQIAVILERLNAFSALHKRILRAHLDKRKISVYRHWKLVREYRDNINLLRGESARLTAGLPELTRRLEDCEADLDMVNGRLASNETGGAIQLLDERIKNIADRLPALEKVRETIEMLCRNMDIPFARKPDEFADMREIAGEKIREIEKQKDATDGDHAGFYARKKELEQMFETARTELDFLIKRRTNIPSAVYSIKEACIRDLNLPADALLFVGELITVKTEENQYERAVEAVLSPIARNLLCRPAHLDQVTAWFNETPLARGMTIKRIKPDELQPRPRKESARDSILRKIELRAPEENPFHDYLWNWLTENFYHRVVSVEEFRRRMDKLVTVEGLVKSDHRTMRKGRANFEYSLGWDTTGKRKLLQATMNDHRDELQDIKAELRALTETRRGFEQTIRALESILEADAEYLSLPDLHDRIKKLEAEKQELSEKDESFANLRTQSEEYKKLRGVLRDEIADTRANLKRNEEDMERNRTGVESETDEMQELLNAPWGPEKRPFRESIANQEMEFEELDGHLDVTGSTPDRYAMQLENLIEELEDKKKRVHAEHALRKYENDYQEPDLPYEIAQDDLIDDFIKEWQKRETELLETELPQARNKWEAFYGDHLLNSIVSTVNEIRRRQQEIKNNIDEINLVLKKTDFENLPREKRYLQITSEASDDARVRGFLAEMRAVEKVITEDYRTRDSETAANRLIEDLETFVEKLREDLSYRNHVTDVRNHRSFKVRSFRRESDGPDTVAETFSGARKDAKSSAQTTQLAYTLLASSLAYRFGFNNPEKGRNSLRLIILDEFGGKFDNEKPRDIVHLLRDMGFQSILVSPMTKADLLAGYISRLVLVHKTSASESKVLSYAIQSRTDYERILKSKDNITD